MKKYFDEEAAKVYNRFSPMFLQGVTYMIADKTAFERNFTNLEAAIMEIKANISDEEKQEITDKYVEKLRVAFATQITNV